MRDYWTLREAKKSISVSAWSPGQTRPSAVTFVASIGIRTLLTGAKAVHSRGGKLVLLNPSSAVEKVLRVTGVDTLMPIFHDADAAIQAVSH